MKEKFKPVEFLIVWVFSFLLFLLVSCTGTVKTWFGVTGSDDRQNRVHQVCCGPQVLTFFGSTNAHLLAGL